jgi:Ca2+-binding EF-hand superfamily protein
MAQDSPETRPLKQMDTNKDKQISKEEYITFVEKKARERGEESFKKLDLNSDGVITVQELKEARKK